MGKTVKFLEERHWLNKDIDQTAYISATVSADKWGKKEEPILDITGTLKIADCTRVVSLDFDCYGSSGDLLKDRIDKLDILIKTLQRFRKALLKAGAVYKKVNAIKNKKAKSQAFSN